MTVTASGFGGGAGEMDDLPNCTQVVDRSARARRPSVGPGQPALVLETNLDDVTGEQLGYAVAAALAGGRPGRLGEPGHHEEGPARARPPRPDRRGARRRCCVPRFRRLTGTLGVRATAVERWPVARELAQTTVDGMTVRMKVTQRAGQAGIRRRGARRGQDGGLPARGGQPRRGGVACGARVRGCARLMTSAMFHYDDAMADLIFAACRERLSMDPVSLDFGGLVESLDAELAGLMRPEGNDAAGVLELFIDKLATAVVSCDSPRFLSFIPAAPTKASLLFDMFVSCSSLHGTSWLEAAGVVVAENQALGVLAAQAGLPDGAGGCFVAGGSAGNLSALMVARDTAAYRRHADAPLRPLVAISEDAHSSVGKALHVLGVGHAHRAHRGSPPHRCGVARRAPRRSAAR